MKPTAHHWNEFFKVLVEVLLVPHMSLPSGASPFAEPTKTNTKRESASGARDGINDLYTMFAPFSDDERCKIDRELTGRGLPALYVFEAFRNKKYQAILKRRKIRDREDYYIVKGVLDDHFMMDTPSDELKILGEIMATHMAVSAARKI